MLRFRFWLACFSILLIILDKYSFIGKIRDYISIFLLKQTTMIQYSIVDYTHLIFLQYNKQNQLQSENQQLKRELEQYVIKDKQLANYKREASSISELNSQYRLYDHYNVIIAKAIIDINYLVNNKLLIDKGTDNGINIGDTVVNKEGVIGQIVLVNNNNAQVRLITSPSSSIYLQSSKTKVKMLAEGIGDGQISVKFINKNEKLQIGDILTTTGLDDLYPSDIPVARITKIFYQNNGFNSALCVPVTDFNKLQYVSVLKNASK